MEKILSLEIPKEEIIYQGKVKKGKKGKGVIRIKDATLENYTYVIFPFKCEDMGDRLMVVIDELFNEKAYLNEDNYQIDFGRKYASKPCIIITSNNPLSLNLMKKEIIYDGEVKKTYSGQGIIRIKDRYLGSRSHIIFPISRKDEGELISIDIEKICNEGIRSNNPHTCRVLLDKKDVGRDCIITLQKGLGEI